MAKYKCVIFDLYNTIIDEDDTIAEREKYRIDSIYNVLEKSMIPINFSTFVERYNQMTDYMGTYHVKTQKAFTPFQQVDYLLKSINVDDFVIFKKVYDCYTEAILQINPKLMKNAELALKYLKEKNIIIGLISNTGRTPGEKIRMLLKELKIYDYFEGLFFSDEIGFLKPNPIIFDMCIKSLSVNKLETIFVGDLKYSDYDGALNYGMDAYLFNKFQDDLFQLSVRFMENY